MLHCNEKFHNKVFIFKDRWDAGKKLGLWLKTLDIKVNLVYAIPMGGIPVGIEVAKQLNVKLDLLICRKLLIPWNREAGFGAVAPDGSFFVDEEFRKYLRLSEEEVEDALNEQLEEIGKRLLTLRGKTDYRIPSKVLVVDDGIAAGYTMLAATRFLRKRGAEKIFIGVPTCSHRGATAVSKEADEVYCLNCRSGFFFAVADAYKKWRDLEMKEVLKILHVNRDILLFKPFSTR